jgi:hypothetical protein
MYDVDLFLQVAHFGEHHFDLSLLAFFFQGGHAFLEGFYLSLEFGLNALEGEEVASLPLVLFGVVVGLLLHLFGLVDASS